MCMTTQTKKYVSEAVESKELSREGYDAMRAVAQWHLGYAAWANDLLDAYLNPADALARLEREGMDVEDFRP